MSVERFILIAMSIFTIISIFYIPKSKHRLAFVSFLVFEATTWLTINILVQTGGVTYPVRLFPRASQAGVLQNFVFYPIIFTWFIILFPRKAPLTNKILHYVVFISAFVWIIFFLSAYTGLQEFVKGTGVSHIVRLYISTSLQFVLCHGYVTWFSKKANALVGV